MDCESYTVARYIPHVRRIHDEVLGRSGVTPPSAPHHLPKKSLIEEERHEKQVSGTADESDGKAVPMPAAKRSAGGRAGG